MGQLRCQVCKRFLGTLNGLQYCKKCDLHYPTESRCFCGRNLDYPKVGSSTITICRCGARHRYLGLGSEEGTSADA
ncbi:hypothetical protein ACFLYR_03580 [Chloroflexota bacterium]